LILLVSSSVEATRPVFTSPPATSLGPRPHRTCRQVLGSANAGRGSLRRRLPPSRTRALTSAADEKRRDASPIRFISTKRKRSGTMCRTSSFSSKRPDSNFRDTFRPSKLLIERRFAHLPNYLYPLLYPPIMENMIQILLIIISVFPNMPVGSIIVRSLPKMPGCVVAFREGAVATSFISLADKIQSHPYSDGRDRTDPVRCNKHLHRLHSHLHDGCLHHSPSEP
jgi:hypothetical protein